MNARVLSLAAAVWFCASGLPAKTHKIKIKYVADASPQIQYAPVNPDPGEQGGNPHVKRKTETDPKVEWKCDDCYFVIEFDPQHSPCENQLPTDPTGKVVCDIKKGALAALPKANGSSAPQCAQSGMACFAYTVRIGDSSDDPEVIVDDSVIFGEPGYRSAPKPQPRGRR